MLKHLETINCYLIFHFTFTHYVVKYLYIITLPLAHVCLVHIYVPTYVDVPISIGHMTTQNKCYLNF